MDMVTLLLDQELYEFTGGQPPTLDQLTRRYALMCGGSRQETEQWHNWILRHRESLDPIGHVQATVTAYRVEVAWTIGLAWQRQGFAREAASAMAHWLTNNGAPSSLAAWVHPDHASSHSIAEFLGMSLTNDVDEDGEQLWSTPEPPA